jgi:hypothetical protein
MSEPAKNPLKWIPARLALAQLRAILEDELNAQAVPVSSIRDGRLSVFAERVSETLESFSVVYHMGSSDGKGPFGPELTPVTSTLGDNRHVLVDQSVWASSADWEKDHKQWDWGVGNFSVTFPSKDAGKTHHYQIFGAAFDAVELRELMPKRKPGSRDRKKDVRWDAWIAEIALAASRGEIELHWDADDLIDHIYVSLQNRLGQHYKPVGRSMTYNAAKAVVDLLDSERASGLGR